jgi:hypothetical protein
MKITPYYHAVWCSDSEIIIPSPGEINHLFCLSLSLNVEHRGLLSEVSMAMCVDVVSDHATDRTSSTQSWCDCQSHLAGSQETWPLNFAYETFLFILFLFYFYSIHARKVFLHAVNLRHGTDGFTSPPKEVVLRIFITLKNPSTSVGIEPANLGSTSPLTTSPPRATINHYIM